MEDVGGSSPPETTSRLFFIVFSFKVYHLLYSLVSVAANGPVLHAGNHRGFESHLGYQLYNHLEDIESLDGSNFGKRG